MHFAGSNLSTDPKCPKCIYKISKNFRVEKSGEISRNLRFSRFFVPASKSDTHHGWGSRIRTYECQRQRLVPYRLAIPHSFIQLYNSPIISQAPRGVKMFSLFLPTFFRFFPTALPSLPPPSISKAAPHKNAGRPLCDIVFACNYFSAACAAARRAIGTRKGEQET